MTSEVEGEVLGLEMGNGAWERWRKSGKATVAIDLENEQEMNERISIIQWTS